MFKWLYFASCLFQDLDEFWKEVDFECKDEADFGDPADLLKNLHWKDMKMSSASETDSVTTEIDDFFAEGTRTPELSQPAAQPEVIPQLEVVMDEDPAVKGRFGMILSQTAFTHQITAL